MVCEKNEKNSPVWKLRALDHARRRAGAVVMGDMALQDPAQRPALAIVAAEVEGVRLLDNAILGITTAKESASTSARTQQR